MSTYVFQWFKRLLATLFICAGIATTFVYSYQALHAQVVHRGIKIGGVAVGGLNKVEVEQALAKAVSGYTAHGLVFTGDDEHVDVSAIVSSLDDPDLNYEFVRFDIETSANTAWQIGRSGNFFRDVKDIAAAVVEGKNIILSVKVDEEYLTKLLKENFRDHEKPFQETSLAFVRNAWQVRPGEHGSEFDYSEAVREFVQGAASLETKTIQLRRISSEPKISTAEAKLLLSQAEAFVERTPFFLTSGERRFEAPAAEVRTWIRLEKENNQPARLAVDEEVFGLFLSEAASALNVPARDAKFEIKDGRVVEFQGSRDGAKIDIPTTRERFEKSIMAEGAKEGEIVVLMTPASVTTDTVNTLGVRELVGRGESTFTGSSRNRIKNITVGVAALNGLLIKPGEEFSLVQALGDVDAAHGYVQEIVIKGNKTQPEYGGGLCQIGTTLFRTVLNAGLPITERQNHSFRVRYYEPAGTDATIYGPHPDMRFVNDTGNYILLQTRIEGTKAVFELWGTRDGRAAHQTEPKIYNFVKPPPTKIIETLDLPLGEKKCTEKAVTGATAEFEYAVTYADGRNESQTFKSYYRPWQEVCLLGVEKLSEQLGAATTTPQVIQ